MIKVPKEVSQSMMIDAAWINDDMSSYIEDEEIAEPEQMRAVIKGLFTLVLEVNLE